MTRKTTGIEWTTLVWNPVRGCTLVSPGCTHCYAMKQAHRFSGPGMPYEGLTRLRAKGGPVWTGEVREIPEMLQGPLAWHKPALVFVNSMSDLFHEDVSDEFIAAVFATMAACPHLTFQVLTKRAERMRAWFQRWASMTEEQILTTFCEVAQAFEGVTLEQVRAAHDGALPEWPLPNVWLGASVEDQQRAHERIPHLVATPAAVRFLSCAPLLGPLDLGPMYCDLCGRTELQLRKDGEFSDPDGNGWCNHCDNELSDGWCLDPCAGPTQRGVSWVIAEGEGGPGARPLHARWLRALVVQCAGARVPLFVKQVGAYVVDRNDAGFEAEVMDPPDPESWPTPVRVEENIDSYREDYQGAPVRVHLKDRKGGDPEEWPAGLRVRQFPPQYAGAKP